MQRGCSRSGLPRRRMQHARARGACLGKGCSVADRAVWLRSAGRGKREEASSTGTRLRVVSEGGAGRMPPCSPRAFVKIAA
eukprot:4625024-Prymnesium_polylepis.1